ncbi:PD-(D/E)XK motif protein [Opitutales bacterium]|nr:PD-(D/E)XK motif protein [Opitutales bacterium]
MKTDDYSTALVEILRDIKRDGHTDGWLERRIHVESAFSLHAAVMVKEELPALIIKMEEALHIARELKQRNNGFTCEVLIGRSHTTIAIRSSGTAYIEIFKKLITYVIDDVKIETNPKVAVKKVAEILELWRRWGESRNEGLSKSTVTGLFGELTFIQMGLDEGCDPLELIKSWKGPTPEESDQDFSLGNCAVEVKTTGADNPDMCIINNLVQLDKIGIRHLYLFRLAFDIRDGSGVTLPELVELLRSKMKDESPVALNDLMKKLLKLKYLHADSDKYLRFGFTKRFFNFYQVKDDFPTLTRKDVRTGVTDAKYTIDLATAAKCTVSSSEVLSRFKKENV